MTAPTNSLWMATVIGTSLLACLSGCQLPAFPADRAANNTLGGDNAAPRLTKRQITDVQLSVARSLELQGETERAMDAYRKAVENAPARSTGSWRLAVLHDRQNQLHESGSLYQQALKLDPNNPDIHCDYGYSLYLQRRWAEAEMHLRQAIAIKSDYPRAHNNLGLLLAQTERFGEALSEFQHSGCSETDAHANLAFVSMLNHNWDQARREYQLALHANPNSAAARTGVENLEALVAKTTPNTQSITLAEASAGRPTRLPGPP